MIRYCSCKGTELGLLQARHHSGEVGGGCRLRRGCDRRRRGCHRRRSVLRRYRSCCGIQPRLRLATQCSGEAGGRRCSRILHYNILSLAGPTIPGLRRRRPPTTSTSGRRRSAVQHRPRSDAALDYEVECRLLSDIVSQVRPDLLKLRLSDGHHLKVPDGRRLRPVPQGSEKFVTNRPTQVPCRLLRFYEARARGDTLQLQHLAPRSGHSGRQNVIHPSPLEELAHRHH